jgi:hypothetical protein
MMHTDKDKAIMQAHAEELYRHCLGATGVYEAFGEMIKLRGLLDIFPGFERVKQDLENTLKVIKWERGLGD